ncbi:MAG TPA: hypothetical protein VF742_07770 [Terracidiphilus sp.]|jgi:hypothetical protein
MMEIQERETEAVDKKVVRYRGAIWTLLILAPMTAEVLSGATRLSFLFVLVPEMLVWGIGALFCRELTRRWRAGWPSLMLLGGALAVAEEFLIQQTSIAPLPFAGVNAAFGRWGGVNWVYFVFMLVYESLWVVVVPVRLTEMLFPKFADAPWLRLRGAIVCVIGFLLGSRAAWFGWIKVARPRLSAAPYSPPLGMLAAGIVTIVALIGLAWMLRGVGVKKTERRIAPAWATGVIAAIASAAWFVLLGMNFQPNPRLTADAALGIEIVLAVMMFALFAVWTRSTSWSVRHEWAVCFGVVLATAVMSSLELAGYTRADAVFKCVVDVLALAGLVWMGIRLDTLRIFRRE